MAIGGSGGFALDYTRAGDVFLETKETGRRGEKREAGRKRGDGGYWRVRDGDSRKERGEAEEFGDHSGKDALSVT